MSICFTNIPFENGLTTLPMRMGEAFGEKSPPGDIDDVRWLIDRDIGMVTSS